MQLSLRKRLFLSAFIVLICFLGVTGIALDKAYRDSVLTSHREALVGYLYAFLAASDVNENGMLNVANNLLERRFSLPGSGLYASVISSETSKHIWKSPSLLGVELPDIPMLKTGIMSFSQQENDNREGYFILNFGVAWQVNNDFNRYVFTIAEDLQRYQGEINSYRKTLWFWLATLAIFLLLVQGLVVHWGLRPLRKVAGEIRAIESGEINSLSGKYPKELAHLTNSINDLIRNERNHLVRYRNTLGDLAHSLKTPLAVLQGYFEQNKISGISADTVFEQVWRMQEIVDYQLQRAAVSGKQTFNKPILIKPVADQLHRALNKVYMDKHLRSELYIDDKACFSGEKGDLMEVLGNVMDNAYKWANSIIKVDVSKSTADGERRSTITITVEDDGPGIDHDKIKWLTQRGVRGDEREGPPGQGIGLGVVREIVESYSGTLDFTKSELGGCKVIIQFQAY